MTTIKLSCRQAWWAEKLSAFDFQVKYRAGKKNPADELSRQSDYCQAASVKWSQTASVKWNQKIDVEWSLSELTVAEIFTERIPATDNLSLRTAVLTQLRTKRNTVESSNHSEKVWDSQTHVSSTENINSKNEQNNSKLKSMKETLSRVSETSADTAEMQQLIPLCLLKRIEMRETAYRSIDTAEFVQTVIAWQSLDNLAKTVQRRLATSQDNASLNTESKDKNRNEWLRRHMWKVNDDNHLLYNECVYMVNDASLQTQVISRYHDDEFINYFSHKRTAELTQWHYDWLKLSSLIKEYCKNCISCQKEKSTRHKLYETLNPLLPPQRSWGSVMMNFITDLPLSKAHNSAVYDTILITLDRLTKMAHYELTRKTINTSDMMRLFITIVVWLHECPDNLSWIEEQCLCLNISICFVFTSELSETSAQHFTPRLTVKLRGKIRQLRPTCECLKMMSKTIE